MDCLAKRHKKTWIFDGTLIFHHSILSPVPSYLIDWVSLPPMPMSTPTFESAFGKRSELKKCLTSHNAKPRSHPVASCLKGYSQ
jgi:hypothetical protein